MTFFLYIQRFLYLKNKKMKSFEIFLRIIFILPYEFIREEELTDDFRKHVLVAFTNVKPQNYKININRIISFLN